MATHDRSAVDRLQRSVVEMVGGQVVRDEERGGYETPAPVSVISGNLPDDSSHREEHPLDDESLVPDWEGAPEQEPETSARSTEPQTDPTREDVREDDGEDRPAARDILEEDLIDEREAQRVRDEDPFAADDEEELR